jgi:hypothetical protein
MPRLIIAIFFILHGFVHLLYSGQSWRRFELQPGMVWPDGSWAFSRILGDETTRLLATLLLVLAAIGFVASGAGILVKQAWWRPMTIAVAMFSTVIYVLFWDGAFQELNDKGAIGLLINMAILAAVLIFQWPDFDF